MGLGVSLNELQQTILDILTRWPTATVSDHLFKNALRDPNDEDILGFGVSKNELIALAGGRPDQPKIEQFKTWMEENKIFCDTPIEYRGEKIFRRKIQ